MVLSVAALLTASAFKWAQELPDLSELDAYSYTATTQIFGRNGEFIGELVPVAGADKASTNRIPVALSDSVARRAGRHRRVRRRPVF